MMARRQDKGLPAEHSLSLGKPRQTSVHYQVIHVKSFLSHSLLHVSVEIYVLT